MKLSTLNNFDFDSNYVIEFENTEIKESFEAAMYELLQEAASLKSMVNTSKKDSVHIGEEVDRRELMQRVKDIIIAEYKKAEKSPKKDPKPIMRLRYLTAGAKTKPGSLKGTDVKAGGKPKELIIYPPSIEDFQKKAENAEAGKSRTAELKPFQIRVKASNQSGDYQIVSLQYMIGVILDKKLYTVKGSSSKIIDFAKNAAIVLFDARQKTIKLADKYNFKKPNIYKVEEIEKNLIDSMVRDQSNAAEANKAIIAAANARKEEGIKDDYNISVYSYRNGKVTVQIKINVGKIADNYGVTKLTASEIPDNWTGTKKAWADKVKDIKAEITDDVQNVMGAKSIVSFDTAWINIFHQI